MIIMNTNIYDLLIIVTTILWYCWIVYRMSIYLPNLLDEIGLCCTFFFFFFFKLLFILVEVHVRGHTSRFSHERQFKLNFLFLLLYGESK